MNAKLKCFCIGFVAFAVFMTAIDLLNKTAFSVTYVPVSGDNIEVSSSGSIWEADKLNFTVDFTNRTFTIE